MVPEIKFGTDGWRGITGDDFTYASVRRVAKGVAEYMKSRTSDPLAVVGYDCRFASEEFARTVADVFAANGVRSLIFDRPSPTQVEDQAAHAVCGKHVRDGARELLGGEPA